MDALDIERRFGEIFRITKEHESRVDQLIDQNFPKSGFPNHFGFLLVPLLGQRDSVDLSSFDKSNLKLANQNRSWSVEADKWSYTMDGLSYVNVSGGSIYRLGLDGSYFFMNDAPCHHATDPKNETVHLVRIGNALADATRVAQQCWTALGIDGPVCLVGRFLTSHNSFWPKAFHHDKFDPTIPKRRITTLVEEDTRLKTIDEVIVSFGRGFLNKLAWSAGQARCCDYFDEDGKLTADGNKVLRISSKTNLIS